MIDVEAVLRQTAALVLIRMILEEPEDPADQMERIRLMVAAVFDVNGPMIGARGRDPASRI